MYKIKNIKDIAKLVKKNFQEKEEVKVTKTINDKFCKDDFCYYFYEDWNSDNFRIEVMQLDYVEYVDRNHEDYEFKEYFKYSLKRREDGFCIPCSLHQSLDANFPISFNKQKLLEMAKIKITKRIEGLNYKIQTCNKETQKYKSYLEKINV